MGIKLISRAVDFLQTASGATIGAYMLRVMDAHAALLPISSLPDDELHTANVALICLINIMGNQEAHKKGQDSPIMIMRPDVLGVGNAALRLRVRCAATWRHAFACCSADRIGKYA